MRQAIERAHGTFVIEPSLTSGLGRERTVAETMIKGSLSDGIRLAMLLAALLSLASAACAALTIRADAGRPSAQSAKG